MDTLTTKNTTSTHNLRLRHKKNIKLVIKRNEEKKSLTTFQNAFLSKRASHLLENPSIRLVFSITLFLFIFICNFLIINFIFSKNSQNNSF